MQRPMQHGWFISMLPSSSVGNSHGFLWPSTSDASTACACTSQCLGRDIPQHSVTDGGQPSTSRLLSLTKSFILCMAQSSTPLHTRLPSVLFGRLKSKKFKYDQETGSSSATAEEAEEAEEDVRAGPESLGSQKSRREPLWAYAFRLIRDQGLTTGDEFSSYVQKLAACGDAKLLSLSMQKGASNIVEKALHIKEADSRLKRSELSRIDILRQSAEQPCTCDRKGDWKSMALELFFFLCTDWR